MPVIRTLIIRNAIAFCLIAAAIAVHPIDPVFAQANFPARPLRLLVPYAAGGGTDAIARLVAQGLGDKLGQSVIVENNGGAGGNLITQQAATSAPDGYTILMANQGPMVINPHLFKNLKVNPLTAFDPVTLITATPLVLVVPKDSQFKSVKEIVEYGKKNPNKLTYGSAGNGSASHLAAVLLTQIAEFEAVHAPYRGAGPALTDLIGGRTEFMITTLPSVQGLMQSSTVRVLAVTTASRLKKYADLPTIAESGWPTYQASAWYGLVVPKGTPKPVVERLRQASIDAIKSGIIKERLESEGADPIGNSPEEFSAMMASESSRWAEIIKKASISID